MNWRQISIVFVKEVADNLRDRRTLTSALVSVVVGPLMILLLLTIMGRTSVEQAERPLDLPVVGSQHAPSLVTFLTQHNVSIRPGPTDPEASVREGEEAVVLVIPETFGSALSAARPAEVRLVVDDSRQSSAGAIRRTERLLAAYSNQIGMLRLMARGVDPGIIEAVAIERRDVATAQSTAATMLGSIPFFIIMSVFIGGMYLAIDTTAGERERGSLEPLLINPVGRPELVLGKLFACLLFTIPAVVATIAVFGLVLNVLPLDTYFGVRVSLSLETLASVFLVSLPMTLLASALQMIIATYTRSFKEAQSYLGFLPLVPGLPGFILSFMPIKVTLWPMLIPTLGQQMLITQMLRGDVLDPLHVMVSSVITIVAGLALVLVTIRLYGRDQLLFTR